MPANIIAAYGLAPTQAIRVFFDQAVSASDCAPGDLVYNPSGSPVASTTTTQHDFNCIDYDVPGANPINGDEYDFAPASPNFVPVTGGTTTNPVDASTPGSVNSGGPGFTTVEFGTAVAPLDFPPGSFTNQTTMLSNTTIPSRVTDSQVAFNTGGTNVIPDDWEIVVTLPPNYVVQPQSGQYS